MTDRYQSAAEGQTDPQSSPKGALAFVLHGHLPYARMQGRWPHGEEWIHEAASSTYVPLLIELTDLADRGVPFRLTIGLTPILMEQLADAAVIAHFEEYVLDRLNRAETDVTRFRRRGYADESRVAEMYVAHFGDVLEAFRGRFERDIVGGFAKLARSGHVELMVSAATHGYLPLLSRASSVAAQLQVGIEAYKRHTGLTPRTIWLPECAYRPAHSGLPGIEDFLEAQGINLFFTEPETLAESPVIAGDWQGNPTSFLPYRIGSSRVNVVARNARTSEQVWSGNLGYPGDPDYREFHRKDPESGLWYWRITGPKVELGDKSLYHPEWAAAKIEAQARHFVSVVDDELNAWHSGTGRPGLICAAYDAELFGHWWFEGVRWLARVLELTSNHADHPERATATAGGDVAAHPATSAVDLPTSSWGRYRTDYTWNNTRTAPLWPVIHARETRMEQLVEQYPAAQDGTRNALNQIARELLLLESSDWPFLVTTGQAAEYAMKRFHAHTKRFDRLADALETDSPHLSHLLGRIAALDNPFPRIDYRVFVGRGAANVYLGPIGPGTPEERHATSFAMAQPTMRERAWGSALLWGPEGVLAADEAIGEGTSPPAPPRNPAGV